MTPPDALATPTRPRSPAAAVDAGGRDSARAAAARPTPRRWPSTWPIFRVSLSERMTYRGDFLLGTILRFLPMVTTILLWQAIYTGLRGQAASWPGSATAR